MKLLFLVAVLMAVGGLVAASLLERAPSARRLALRVAGIGALVCFLGVLLLLVIIR